MLTVKGMAGNNYLDIDILQKAPGVYTVRVFNNTGSAVNMTYNTKMCFESDAKNWENLNDKDTIAILNGKYVTVTVMTNWFADSMVFSSYKNGTRYLTY